MKRRARARKKMIKSLVMFRQKSLTTVLGNKTHLPSHEIPRGDAQYCSLGTMHEAFDRSQRFCGT